MHVKMLQRREGSKRGRNDARHPGVPTAHTASLSRKARLSSLDRTIHTPNFNHLRSVDPQTQPTPIGARRHGQKHNIARAPLIDTSPTQHQQTTVRAHTTHNTHTHTHTPWSTKSGAVSPTLSACAFTASPALRIASPLSRRNVSKEDVPMESLRVCFRVSSLLLDIDSMPLSLSSESARCRCAPRKWGRMRFSHQERERATWVHVNARLRANVLKEVVPILWRTFACVSGCLCCCSTWTRCRCQSPPRMRAPVWARAMWSSPQEGARAM